LYASFDALCLTKFQSYPNQSVVLSEEEAFTLVHESDQSRCGERLVCELASRSRFGLLSDEESLLSLIKYVTKLIEST